MGSKSGDKVKETQSEKVAAEIARKEYDFARQLDPIKELYQERVAQLDSLGAELGITGKANIGAQNKLSQAKTAQNTSHQQIGIDPSSGRAGAANVELSNAVGDSVGRSQAEAAFAQKSAALEGMNNRIAMALGEKTKAVAGLQDIAAGSQQQAVARLQNKLGNKAALAGAIGTGAGVGLSAYQNRTPYAKEGTGGHPNDYKGLSNWKLGG